ncbi:uncharacterized protein LOC120001133 [Tripterygium wilfordii]|uniref:uncharacterized protein LOC120001133 n=1 Tax=Tripterygium wilfordii TaxID=458696 RepID=UPI0018F83782|nr:uncharacterized protein LOC120001133 [Tripterygium wilfordii]
MQGEYKELSVLEHMQAHFYVLKNCEDVNPWVEEHMDELLRQSSRNVEKRHQEQFATWFEKRVTQLRKENDERAHDQLFSLARGPDRRVTFYKGYITKGFRFHTKERELSLKTQNSGVIVKGDELTGSVDYYGVIKDIIELEYFGENRVVLYRCDWFDVPPQGRNQTRGYNKDDFGFITLDMTRICYQNEPFVLASQADQVYYVKGIKNSSWHTVVKVKPRNLYDVPELEK